MFRKHTSDVDYYLREKETWFQEIKCWTIKGYLSFQEK